MFGKKNSKHFIKSPKQSSHHHENSETRPHLTREHEGSRRVGLLLLKSKNEKRFLIYVIWQYNCNIFLNHCRTLYVYIVQLINLYKDRLYWLKIAVWWDLYYGSREIFRKDSAVHFSKVLKKPHKEVVNGGRKNVVSSILFFHEIYRYIYYIHNVLNSAKK